ncbi:hypothetical protein BGZ89_008736 [Linnemannia elongata]|nr:hypothetical protein BGZ89_008736 [Linnemannia elongata]
MVPPPPQASVVMDALTERAEVVVVAELKKLGYRVRVTEISSIAKFVLSARLCELDDKLALVSTMNDLTISVLIITLFTLVTVFSIMTTIARKHPLDLHEICTRIARSLDLNDLASCARVCQDWNSSFTPPLYNSVVLSKQGVSIESYKRNKKFIQHLWIERSVYEQLPSTLTRDKVIFNIVANSTLTSLDLRNNLIGDNGAQALAEALKTNSTLTTLKLWSNSIGPDGARALSEALKTNSTLTTLDLLDNSIGDHGAQAFSEALKANSTLTILNLKGNSIGPNGAQAQTEALKTNPTVIIECDEIE